MTSEAPARASDWVARLQLSAHPEGGYYRRVYTDARRIATAQGPRALASSIHYLLTPEQPVGRLHRNRSVILHYLQHGGPVEYLLLTEDGALQRERLGFGEGEALFLEVPGGVWKSSRLVDGADHALVSEVVIPGFDFADHEFLSREALLSRYPGHAAELTPLAAGD